jgi:hypothetical protein
MARPFDEFGKEYGDWWEEMAPKIRAALHDGHVLQPNPDTERRLAEADELARRLEDD